MFKCFCRYTYYVCIILAHLSVMWRSFWKVRFVIVYTFTYFLDEQKKIMFFSRFLSPPYNMWTAFSVILWPMSHQKFLSYFRWMVDITHVGKLLQFDSWCVAFLSFNGLDQAGWGTNFGPVLLHRPN